MQLGAILVVTAQLNMVGIFLPLFADSGMRVQTGFTVFFTAHPESAVASLQQTKAHFRLPFVFINIVSVSPIGWRMGGRKGR